MLFIYIYRPNRNGGPTEAEQLAAASTGELRFSYSLLEKLIHYIDRASINMKLLKPSGTFSRRSSFKICTRDITFFSKVYFNDYNKMYILFMVSILGCTSISREIFQYS